MLQNGHDVLAQIDGLLNPQEYEIAGYVFVIRPMKGMEFLEILGTVPVLPSATSPKFSEVYNERQKEIYIRLYEQFVDGIKNGEDIIQVPVEKWPAGIFQGLGDRIMAISGWGGSRLVEQAGRSL